MRLGYHCTVFMCGAVLLVCCDAVPLQGCSLVVMCGAVLLVCGAVLLVCCDAVPLQGCSWVEMCGAVSPEE